MAKNVIIMIGDGMGWEMARAAATANGVPFYTSGQGEGLNFQTLENYTLATTYGTTIADGRGIYSTGNSAVDGSELVTGGSPIRTGFSFNPAFNPGNTSTGGATLSSGVVGNLVGYDPVRGGINPWTPGTDPQYIQYSYPDSANTATTLYTGVKSYNNAIAVDIYEQPLETILATASLNGKSTGLVTSVPIDHATPGAAAATVNRRGKYDSEYPALDSILQQELRVFQPTVLLGGGHPLSTPGDPLPEGVEPNTSNEFISKSTYAELSNNPTSNIYNYTFLERGTDAASRLASTAANLDPNNGDRLLGLYGARGQNGNLPVSSANGDYSTTGLDMFSLFSSAQAGNVRNITPGIANPDTLRPLLPGETDASFIAREINENPTLQNLTTAALNVLGKDQDGFWLMVEGGDIDWSAHDNNIDNLIGTVNDFDKAVKSTIDWINSNGGWEDNLLIVTADHDHYLNLNPNFAQLLQQNGAEALTAQNDPTQAGHFWGSNPDVKYGWGNHSNRPVPVYYQGAGSEVLTNSVGQGYTSYGYDIAGIPGLVDQTNIYQTMYAAVTGSPKQPVSNESQIVYGDATSEFIYTGAGDDTIYAGEGRNVIYANDGNNTVYGGSGDDVIYTSFGNDLIFAGVGNNSIFSGAGDDTIYAGSGDDLIYAGAGNDVIYANDGNNIINAGAGNNVVYAGSGDDDITTGAGNDLIYAGEGNNIISAGTGNDTVYTVSGIDRFILDAGVGSVTIYNFSSNDFISRGVGLRATDALTLSISGNDTLVSVGADLLATLKWVQLDRVSIV
ncbi:alkaline phosphatase [Plectonema radiosum NIES-515]|uniref:Alkaline phosphatase n=1 Tax=Plectonema radiosum NIES-515 TaxID=2986073 RepID=A0ABT3AWX7_9CYAN|nr:alkaline phosphatase [Plectonema radiosum]MCV3213628.1 alkaline phosphatase [Plectonema radiosum NIES-515]